MNGRLTGYPPRQPIKLLSLGSKRHKKLNLPAGDSRFGLFLKTY
jgi:hypothetical protein